MKTVNSNKAHILKLVEKEFWSISPTYNGATIPGLLKCTLNSLMRKGKIDSFQIKKIDEYVIEFTITFDLNGNKVIQDAYLNY